MGDFSFKYEIEMKLAVYAASIGTPSANTYSDNETF